MVMLQEKSCQWADERLEEYLEGELSPVDTFALEGHLGSCVRCRREEARAREITAELRGLPSLDAPQRVLGAVDEKADGSRFFHWKGPFWWVPVSGALAATLLILVVLAPLLRPSPQEPIPDQEVVAAAVAEARFALAYVGKISQQTGSTLREEQLKPWVLTPLAAVMASPGQGNGEKQDVKEI